MATIKTQEELDEERRRKKEAEAAREQAEEQPVSQPVQTQPVNANLPLSEQYRQTSQANIDADIKAGNDLANIYEQQGQQTVAAMEGDQKAYNDALNEAQRQYRARMDAGYKNIYDVITNEDARIRQEQQLASDMVRADAKAAQWTGITELASSIANLVGVGSFNAVSQQYKSPSIDWMKKADQDMREHRYRMDNLKARQNQLRMQLDQMKMGDAQQALARARDDANTAYSQRVALQQARNDAALKGAQVRYETGKEARAAGLQGIAGQASLKHQETAEAQAWANLKEQQRYHDAMTASRSASSGKPTGDIYDIGIDGKTERIRLSKQTYEEGVKRGTPELKKDLVEKAKARLREEGIPVPDDFGWDDLNAMSGQKKVQVGTSKVANPLYGFDSEIMSALNGSGDTKADYEAIARYADDHRLELNNFNRYLKGLSLQQPQGDDDDPLAGYDSIYDFLMSQE